MAENGQNRASFDSGRQHLGAVYAKALLGATEKLGQTEPVLEQLESLVADVLDRLPQFEAALSTPRIAVEEKVRILQKAFGGRMSPVLLNFLNVAAQHGRLDCLRAIARQARHYYNELRNRVEVRLQSAQPLSNPLRELIASRLQQLLGREVDLQSQVDPELLGGIVVRVGDTVYDGSLANKLNRMRGVALERTARTMRGSLDRFALS
jgi:F-type H+-transporting ATPase subunit delta